MWVRSVAWDGSFSLQLTSGHKKTVSIGIGVIDADLFTGLFLGVMEATEIPSMDGFEMSDLNNTICEDLEFWHHFTTDNIHTLKVPCVDVDHFL